MVLAQKNSPMETLVAMVFARPVSKKESGIIFLKLFKFPDLH